MPIDLTDPNAAYDGVTAAKLAADQVFRAAIVAPGDAYRAALAVWQAAALARVAGPLDDVNRDAEVAAWQALGDARQAFNGAVATARAARTAAIKTALGG